MDGSSFSIYGIKITEDEMKQTLTAHGISFDDIDETDESIENEIEDVVDKVDSDEFDTEEDDDEKDFESDTNDEFIEEDENDAYQKFEELVDDFELFCYTFEDEGEIYIGREWSTIGDNETGLEFKKSTEEALKKLLGNKRSCDTIEECFYDI